MVISVTKKKINRFTVTVVAVFLFLPCGQRTAHLQPAEGKDSLHAKIRDPEESVVVFLQLSAMTTAVSKATLIFICPSTCRHSSLFLNGKKNVQRIEMEGNWLQITCHRSLVGSDKVTFNLIMSYKEPARRDRVK